MPDALVFLDETSSPATSDAAARAASPRGQRGGTGRPGSSRAAISWLDDPHRDSASARACSFAEPSTAPSSKQFVAQVLRCRACIPVISWSSTRLMLVHVSARSPRRSHRSRRLSGRISSLFRASTRSSGTLCQEPHRRCAAWARAAWVERLHADANALPLHHASAAASMRRQALSEVGRWAF